MASTPSTSTAATVARGIYYEERFSAWVVNDEAHLENTIRYVLENPVRAGLCRRVEDGVWSWASSESIV